MIRKASGEDISTVMALYGSARAYMRKSGNMRQWVGGYPSRPQIEEDARCGCLYVLFDECGIYGVFMMRLGDDPAYAVIRDGSWLDDSPYAVIHRIASSGRRGGVLHEAVSYTLSLCPHIRIDTHEDNRPMQSALGREGFSRCGIIQCSDGTDRIAYELSIASGSAVS